MAQSVESPPVPRPHQDASAFARALTSVRTYGRMIRFSHTLFGLPFALAATALAHRFSIAHHTSQGLTAWRLLLIVLAFTGARSAAMGFNRIVDRKIDALNPRTAQRELPQGVISLPAAWALTLAAAAVFVASAWALGPLPRLLALPCLLVVLGYSYFKRFSWFSHLFLGLALALAPGGAWIAVAGTFEGWVCPALLMVAVATWVGGFDVLYSLSDIEFDRDQGLHSIPARFGVRGALWISGALHVVTVAALGSLHLYAHLGLAHLAGVVLIAGILAWEHSIVKPSDLSRLGQAFFALNGYISLAYLAFALLDVLLLG
jgi:4-hydroxybenzoate polyprenyltransferase